MHPAHRPALRRAQRLRTVLLVVLLLAGSAVGGWRALSATAGTGPSTLVVVGVSYTVVHVEQVAGLADADLGGMSHGIQGLVTPDQALVVVSLVVDAADRPSDFDPSVLQALLSDSSRTLTPAGGTLAAGRLGRRGRMEGTVSFVVARGGGQLALRAPGAMPDVPLLPLGLVPDGDGHHDPPAPRPGSHH